MKRVIYKMIAGFPGYRVGSDGSVWTRFRRGPARGQWSIGTTWKKLKQYRITSGYISIRLYPGPVNCLVHRIVLEAFVGPCPDGMEACHFPDPDKANNNLSNLRWDTPKANAADAAKHGRVRRGETHPLAVLTEAKVREIRGLLPTNLTKAAIARRFNVSRGTVRMIASGKAWRHV